MGWLKDQLAQGVTSVSVPKRRREPGLIRQTVTAGVQSAATVLGQKFVDGCGRAAQDLTTPLVKHERSKKSSAPQTKRLKPRRRLSLPFSGRRTGVMTLPLPRQESRSQRNSGGDNSPKIIEGEYHIIS